MFWFIRPTSLRKCEIYLFTEKKKKQKYNLEIFHIIGFKIEKKKEKKKGKHNMMSEINLLQFSKINKQNSYQFRLNVRFYFI